MFDMYSSVAWREEWHRDFEPDRVAVGSECFLAMDLTTEACDTAQ